MSQGTMRYKGYVGSVQYSDEDGCFIGDVLGVQAMISFEGESVAELRTDFENAIEAYLKSCKERRIKPEKPKPGKITLDLPFDIEVGLENMTEETGKSAKALILDAVKGMYFPLENRAAPRTRQKQAVKANAKRKPVAQKA